MGALSSQLSRLPRYELPKMCRFFDVFYRKRGRNRTNLNLQTNFWPRCFKGHQIWSAASYHQNAGSYGTGFWSLDFLVYFMAIFRGKINHFSNFSRLETVHWFNQLLPPSRKPCDPATANQGAAQFLSANQGAALFNSANQGAEQLEWANERAEQ